MARLPSRLEIRRPHPDAEVATGPSRPERRISAAEAVAVGLIQEANRLFFHPRGYALEVVEQADGAVEIGGIQDHGDAPASLFIERPSLVRARRIDERATRTRRARELARGYLHGVQPLEGAD